MTTAELMLEEFDRSLKGTRQCLERVPTDKLGWRPAEKSMSLGQLALHIATSPGAVVQMGLADSLELPDFGAFPEAASRDEILEAFEHSIATVRSALAGVDDARMNGQLAITRQGQQVMAFPRHTFLRDIMLNHTYHHRGQLTVYLRLLGVPLPAVMGPSADEQMPM